MIIGIDFDNTIACHDEPFRKIASEQGLTIPNGKKPKQVVKDFFLGKENGNLEWTRIQGKLYGTELSSAELFEGFVEFIELAVSLGHKIVVISHRTIFPAVGEPIDLHNKSLEWLQAKGLLSPQRIIPDNCFFEVTLEQKLERIASEKCDLFIDDLITVFQHEKFPKATKEILFGKKHESLEYIESWKDAERLSACPKIKNKSPQIAPSTLSNKLHAEGFRKLLNLNTDHKLILTTLNGGGNNRSYRIKTCEKVFMGKVYFRNSLDSRDRLLHETSFSQYLEYLSLENFPKLIAADKILGIAAFDWLSGKIYESDSVIDLNYWKLCLEFLFNLQSGKDCEKGRKLPNASESAFSLREHWGLLQSRHDYWLRRILREPDSIPNSIKVFLLEKVENNYQELAKEVIANPSFDYVIPKEEQILSPSDFGLHNTLLRTNGTLFFYDFEYAGWDDPAKTIADFFAQPRQQVPRELFKVMKDQIIDLLPDSGIRSFIERLPLVVRMINLKWCYICLNIFHPVDNQRRKLSKTPAVDLTSLHHSLNRLVNDSPITHTA